MSTIRRTFTIPESMSNDIEKVAKSLGISQSALLSQIMEEPIRYMASLIDSYAQQTQETDPEQAAKRMRGQSVEHVEQLYREFQEYADREGKS